jgi:hypothetical protein
MRATPSLLENDFIRVELNAAGDIARIYDKRCNREVLAEGKIANQFQVFEDRPLKWDAWDVDIFYDDKMWLSEPAAMGERRTANPSQHELGLGPLRNLRTQMGRSGRGGLRRQPAQRLQTRPRHPR